MANKASLTIEVLVDAAKGAAGLDQASGKVGKFSSGLSKATGPAAAGLAAISVAAKKAGDSASRLEQSSGAVESVFGKQSGQIEKWAKTSAGSVGLASAEYQEMASVIGAQLKNLGTPLDQVAGKTDEMIRLGADLSATYGGTTTEAVEALASALKGETDPIEKYGISVKNAAVEAAVGSDKLKKMTDAQQSQAKTTALLGIVTEQAGGAIGAFGRESDTAAGQQQRAEAAMEDASAQLGSVLLPLMAQAAKALATFAGWLTRNKTLVLVLATVIGAVSAAIIGLNLALKAYAAVQKAISAATKAWAAVQWLLNAAMLANPIGLVILAIVALIAVIVLLWKKNEAFRTAVIGAWNAIKTAAVAAWNAIKGAAVAVWNAMKTVASSGVARIKALFTSLKTFASTVWTAIKNAIAAAWTAIRNAISTQIDKVKALVEAIKTKAGTVWTAIKNAIPAAWSAIKNAISNEIDKMKALVEAIKTKAGTIWTAIKDAIPAAWKKITDAITKALKPAMTPIDAIKTAIDAVVGAVKSLIEWIGKIKIPKIKIPGFGGKSASSSAAPSVLSAAGRGTTAPASTTSGQTVININGALDPVAVARQVRAVLLDDDRRRRGVHLGRAVVVGGGA